MNDLRSPSEDRPYRPATNQSPRLAQDDVDPEYGMSFFDRVRYSRWFPLASVFAAVLIFSGIVSYAYKQGSQTGENATTPVVMAGSADYKQKPADAGGMDVPFQDAVVFDQLQNKDQAAGTESKTESLLPPPEQAVANTPAPATPEAVPSETPAATTNAATPAPAETPVAATAPATTASTVAPAPTTPTVTETVAAAPEPKTIAETTTAPAEEVSAPEEKPLAVPAKKPVVKAAAPAPAPKKIAVATPAPKASTPVVKTESGTFRIQLGAFRDESAARSAWSKVAQKYGSLSGVTSAFPRADLGAKGIFYRAQGVNLSKASADNLCRTINADKAGSCIVTH